MNYLLFSAGCFAIAAGLLLDFEYIGTALACGVVGYVLAVRGIRSNSEETTK